jgi:hypothetical protein
MGRAEDDIPSPITLPLTMIKEEDCHLPSNSNMYTQGRDEMIYLSKIKQ